MNIDRFTDYMRVPELRGPAVAVIVHVYISETHIHSDAGMLEEPVSPSHVSLPPSFLSRLCKKGRIYYHLSEFQPCLNRAAGTDKWQPGFHIKLLAADNKRPTRDPTRDHGCPHLGRIGEFRCAVQPQDGTVQIPRLGQPMRDVTVTLKRDKPRCRWASHHGLP